jgi:hypothetical protein
MAVRALALVGGGLWSRSGAKYSVEEPSTKGLLVVAVRCRFGDAVDTYKALLDTGAQYSVIGGDTAEVVGDQATPVHAPMTMSTRLGKITGQLHRLDVTLVADDGQDLRVESTVLLCPEWGGPIVLGYLGLLDRLRIALDPGVTGGNEWFYFGEAQ